MTRPSDYFALALAALTLALFAVLGWALAEAWVVEVVGYGLRSQP